MLQLMLHAHPDIAIPPETRFLLEAYDRREQFGDLRERRNRRRLAKFITRRRGKLGDLGLDRAMVRRRIVRGPATTVGDAGRAVFQAYSQRFGARRWGDKRPAHVQRLEVLLRLFPDAHIIHIIRDGRDCVSSLTRMPWWDGGAIAAIWTWRNAVNCGRRRWRDDLQPWERDLFHLVARRQLRATGYPLQRPDRLPPIPVLVRYARYLGYREAYLRYRRVRDRVRQWRYRRPVAAEAAVSAGNGVTHSHDLPSGALR